MGAIPTKYSQIVSQLLAGCGDPTPFAAKFVYNLMGPIFYELTMMAMLPSDHVAGGLTSTEEDSGVAGIKVDSILKFLCFLYLESAVQYEATEDVFDTLAFCDRYEVTELQEYCAMSLKSLTEHNRLLLVSRGGQGMNESSQKDRMLGKRLCDCVLLFLGGRIPFYFNEEELTLLHSVLIETILDVTYANRSEFDLAESGIRWLQRKLLDKSPANRQCPLAIRCETRRRKKKPNHIPDLLILVNLLGICTFYCDFEGANIFASIEDQGTLPVTSEFLKFLHCTLLQCCTIWTWISCAVIRLRLWDWRRHGITLLLYLIASQRLDRDALKSIITVRQQVNAIIHRGKGP